MFALWMSFALAATSSWEQTIDRVSPGIVSIRVTQPRSFDTEGASISNGTGFVVDAERGILLTNRHMVHAGPVRAEATFSDNETVTLTQLYRDPVHDFGFYQFDPNALQYMDLVELELAPGAASVGMDIRVIGNNAGEKISILDSTLARLDRNAPDYGRGKYNDFNTFYYQAASNTSGGSSGSPVLNQQGQVVALNAGGSSRAASSFYLPLHRVQRAFENLQSGDPNPRGTIQSTLRHQPFSKLDELGLSGEEEAEVRKAFPSNLGMLVFREVLPTSSVYDVFRSGDILTHVGDERVVGFATLEALLDDNVGKTLAMTVLRLGERITVDVRVQDLHAITPSAYLEVSNATLNNLSYQKARTAGQGVEGVYLAFAGYMFSNGGVPAGTVIDTIDGEPVASIDQLGELLSGMQDRQPFRVRWHYISDPERAFDAVVHMDRRWFDMRSCAFDSGDWECASYPEVDGVWTEPMGGVPFPVDGDKRVQKLAPSLVMVNYEIPFSTSGVRGDSFVGVGTILDVEQGLVFVDRDTVPVALGDMQITFGGTLRVPGELVYLHPTRNYAVIRYEPSLVSGLDVRAVEFSTKPVEKDATIYQVGLDGNQRVVSKKTIVENIEAIELGTSGTPRFRSANAEGIVIKDAAPSYGGVLTDKAGRVQAMWASYFDPKEDERYFWGLPAADIQAVIAAIRAGEQPSVLDLGVEYDTIKLVDARDLGVPVDTVAALAEAAPDRLQVLRVLRVRNGSPPASALQSGDLLTHVNGVLVTNAAEVRDALAPESSLTVVRGGESITVDATFPALGDGGVNRALVFAGGIVHNAPLEVAMQRSIVPKGVYVAWVWYGSPMREGSVSPTRQILSVNDRPTPDLDSFIAAISELPERAVMVMQTMGLDGRKTVRTMKIDDKFWPTLLLERQESGWTRTELRTAD